MRPERVRAHRRAATAADARALQDFRDISRAGPALLLEWLVNRRGQGLQLDGEAEVPGRGVDRLGSVPGGRTGGFPSFVQRALLEDGAVG